MIKNYFDHIISRYIIPRKKFKIRNNLLHKNKGLLKSIDNNLKALDLYINELQPSFSIPVLMKKYLRMNGKIIGFNIDPDFNNCLDGLMMLNIIEIPLDIFDNLTKDIDPARIKDRITV